MRLPASGLEGVCGTDGLCTIGARMTRVAWGATGCSAPAIGIRVVSIAACLLVSIARAVVPAGAALRALVGPALALGVGVVPRRALSLQPAGAVVALGGAGRATAGAFLRIVSLGARQLAPIPRAV